MGVRRVILSLVLLIAPMAAQAQSEPALWRFADPNSKSAIGIDWARVRNSPVGAMLRATWTSHGVLPGLPALGDVDAIDHVLISSTAVASAAGSHGDAGTDESEGPSILAAIQGHFDGAQMRQLFVRAGAKAQSYNSFQVYRPQANKNRDHAYVLYDAHTILYGDAPLVFAALDRNEFGPPGGQAAKPGSIAARAAELDAKYEIWAILDVDEVASSDALTALFRGNEWASAAQGIEVGLNLEAGLDADFILRYTSEETARHITADLSNAVNAAAKDKSVGVQAQDLAKKLRFSVDGSATKVSLHVNDQELEQMARAFSAGIQSGERAAARNPAVAPASSSAPASAGAGPSKPPVIRIEGLDEGTREIPYQQPQQ